MTANELYTPRESEQYVWQARSTLEAPTPEWCRYLTPGVKGHSMESKVQGAGHRHPATENRFHSRVEKQGGVDGTGTGHEMLARCTCSEAFFHNKWTDISSRPPPHAWWHGLGNKCNALRSWGVCQQVAGAWYLYAANTHCGKYSTSSKVDHRNIPLRSDSIRWVA